MAKYKLNLGQAKLRRLRASGAFYSHWDDHEFVNDFAPGENTFSGGTTGPDSFTLNRNGRRIYKDGVKAFRDYAPVSYTRQGRPLPQAAAGARTWRSSSSTSGRSALSKASGQSQTATTLETGKLRTSRPTAAPEATRNVFARSPSSSLAKPVPPRCHRGDQRPEPDHARQALHSARFTRTIKARRRRFKVVMNELAIQQYYADPYDRWEGYSSER